MPIERFYIDTPLTNGEEIQLEENEFHHLVRVMRGEVGDKVELINGQGSLAQTEISAINKREALLTVLETTTQPPPARQVILAQAMPRFSRLETIVEKGTELGMTQLWLFPGARSEKKDLNDNQQQRLKIVAISAVKQCGSLFLPRVELKAPLSKWKELPCRAYFGDLAPTAPSFVEALRKHPAQEDIIFAVGPESGFTEEELAILRQLGATGVKLHSNILRTETAPLAALSLIHGLLELTTSIQPRSAIARQKTRPK